MNDKAAEITVFIDRVGIPGSEIVVGPLIDRMVEIESARIDRQLVKFIRVEPSVAQEDRIGTLENFDRLSDKVAVLPLRRAGVREPEGNRLQTERTELNALCSPGSGESVSPLRSVHQCVLSGTCHSLKAPRIVGVCPSTPLCTRAGARTHPDLHIHRWE